MTKQPMNVILGIRLVEEKRRYVYEVESGHMNNLNVKVINNIFGNFAKLP